MIIINKESKSGVIYKGVDWSNTCCNPNQWLVSIYDKPFVEKKVEKVNPKITVLVENGKVII